MKLILTADVEPLGKRGDVVDVAEGYARSTGRVGVVLVTSGPGATNTVTGLTDALMDSVPLVCLTGQVPTQMIGNDAFQEADTVGITRPCTKHNYLVKSGDALARVIHEAIHVARSGRPGPVVIDLPKDVLMAPAPYTPRDQVSHRTYNPKVDPAADQVEQVVDLMAKARRPIFYVGGGLINAGPEACAALTELVRATEIQSRTERAAERNELAFAQREFGELAVFEEIRAAVFVAPDDRVVLSSRRDWVDRPLNLAALGLADAERRNHAQRHRVGW